MKKLFVFVLPIIILGAASYFVFFDKKQDDFNIRFDKVTKGDVTLQVTATGKLSAVTTVQVGSQVSGTVSKLYADFNSIVKEGQLLAQIDPTILDQNVKDAEASLERIQAQYNQSKRDLDRIQSLFEKKLETQANYDNTLTTLESSKAQLKQSQLSLEKAKTNLNYASIYAPINGVVIGRQIDIGQTVAASFSAPTLFTIANDLKKMQVQATVDESDVGKISVGQEVSFTVDAYPEDKFTGKVSQIRLSSVEIQNVVNYTVIIDVVNSELKLMPGMTANVKILIAKKSGVLRVPNLALRFQPPQELIDTVKLREMREAFRGRGQGGPDAEKRTADSSAMSQKKNQDNSQNQKSSNDNRQTDGRGRIQMGDNKSGDNKSGDNRSGNDRSGNRSNDGKQSNDARGNQGDRQGGFNQGGNTQGGMSQLSDADRERFRKVRDSINNAHGGNLSREEMMQEMQKIYQRSQRTQQPQMSAKVVAPEKTNTATIKTFEIIQKYPLYEKTSTVAQVQYSRGRIWIQDVSGKLIPIMVRTGLNDGQFTEIIADNIDDGTQIVISAFSTSQSAQQQNQRNPFTGQQQQGQGMMGRGR